jgi:hypothetical protein
MGLLNDDAHLLEEAARYLRAHQGDHLA